jgi:hypothetical protein
MNVITQCVICYDEIKEGPIKNLSCTCTAPYHKRCIEQWRDIQNICSIYRIPLISIEYLRRLRTPYNSDEEYRHEIEDIKLQCATQDINLEQQQTNKHYIRDIEMNSINTIFKEKYNEKMKRRYEKQQQINKIKYKKLQRENERLRRRYEKQHNVDKMKYKKLQKKNDTLRKSVIHNKIL